MASNPPIPTQWVDVFADRSLRTVAAAAGISVDRLSRFIRGHKIADGTADMVADALGISVTRAWELRGTPVVEPFRLPDKAHNLSRRQRDAVLSVIDAMLEPGTAQVETPENEDRGLRSVTPLAARKGETRDQKRRRLEVAPEDQSQDPGDDK